MQLSFALMDHVAGRSLRWAVLSTALIAGPATAKPLVEFDFARAIECRDVTGDSRSQQYPAQRLIQMTLPISVRFRDVSLDDVEELDVEIDGTGAGLVVHDFSPDTQMTTDIDRPIETTTTVRKTRGLDASLGGTLPIPGADLVAHVTPTINGSLSRGDTVSEKSRRLPPKQATVVSGTSSEGRGVFFKLKRYSQTSLEGVHEIVVTFVAPANWQSGVVRIGCAARGYRKMLWLDQPSTLGRTGREVTLYLTSNAMKPLPKEGPVHRAIERRANAEKLTVEGLKPEPPLSFVETVTAEMGNFVGVASTDDYGD